MRSFLHRDSRLPQRGPLIAPLKRLTAPSGARSRSARVHRHLQRLDRESGGTPPARTLVKRRSAVGRRCALSNWAEQSWRLPGGPNGSACRVHAGHWQVTGLGGSGHPAGPLTRQRHSARLTRTRVSGTLENWVRAQGVISTKSSRLWPKPVRCPNSCGHRRWSG
jgi:hypothetical protein